MELDPSTLRRVWWRGAISSALKGIPQGLILGAAGTLLLVGLCAVLPASWGLATAMGGFLFSEPVAVAGITLGNINLVPMVALNTVLTAVGNFIHGGSIACSAYKQDVEHRMNLERIEQIEAREKALEQALPRSRAVNTILTQGPRTAHSFEAAELSRAESPSETVLH